MKTLSDLWREYRDKVYPADISALKNRECHQAFMAGAFIALKEVEQLSVCPDTEEAERDAATQIGKLIQEAEEIMRWRMNQAPTKTINQPNP